MERLFKQWTHFVCVIFLFTTLFITETARANQAGVVLTFDDTSVDQWHDFFARRNDVRATFFVSHWHTLSSPQIEKLRALQNTGHEIGCHSYNHTPIHHSPYLSDPAKASLYVAEQVIPAVANMQAAGFYPTSFAYPNGRRAPAYDDAIRPYLPYLRSTTPNGGQTLSTLDELYHSSSTSYGFLSGDGIDSSYQNELPEIEAALTRAKNRGEILTLYAHRILPEGETHDYGTSASKLAAVIDKARALGLRFYTFQEAYRVGNGSGATTGGGSTSSASGSITASVEGERVRIGWENTPNDFIGIASASQGEWQSGLPGAVTDGSANGKIGITLSVLPRGQAYVAVLYRNNSKVAVSPTFNW